MLARHHPQSWHRGSGVRSGRCRYLLQQQYGAPAFFAEYNDGWPDEFQPEAADGAESSSGGLRQVSPVETPREVAAAAPPALRQLLGHGARE